MSEYVGNARVLGISTLDTIPFAVATLLGILDVKLIGILLFMVVSIFALNVLKNAIAFEAHDAEVLNATEVPPWARSKK